MLLNCHSNTHTHTVATHRGDWVSISIDSWFESWRLKGTGLCAGELLNWSTTVAQCCLLMSPRIQSSDDLGDPLVNVIHPWSKDLLAWFAWSWAQQRGPSNRPQLLLPAPAERLERPRSSHGQVNSGAVDRHLAMGQK